ncbi:phage tail protein [Hafnia paralvei]|uniref:phage tail protein n=1 Tax=Hafnia paralvei TaxID=546367 RepID=UPI00141A557A|nr:phage tail protein [Hafnia paralvei]NIH31926.1 phage tail protein [Hafnia paralvei]
MKNLKTALLTPSANILACQLFGANVSIRQLTLGELYDYEEKLKTLQDKNDAHATSLLGAQLVLSAIVDETGAAIPAEQLPTADELLRAHANTALLDASLLVQRHSYGTLEDAQKN